MQTIAHDHPLEGARTTISTGAARASWTGRALSVLAVLFLVFDSIGKLLQVQPVIDATIELGYPQDVVFTLGVLLLSSVVVYAIPATAAVGAVLLTGYLGGAVATHVRAGNPLFTHTFFPVYLAVLLWGGLLLRDARMRVLLPWHGRDRRFTATSGGRHE